MTKQSDQEEMVQKDITQMFSDRAAKAWSGYRDGEVLRMMELVPKPPVKRSPYHFIRHTTHGKTAPFINMPLGQTRVYVERIR